MKVLWLKTELLHPVDKGGKIRTYQMLKQLRRDHFVTYLTLCDPDDPRESFDSAREYCQRLLTVPHNPTLKFSVGFYCELGRNLGSSVPYAIQRYRSRAMTRAIERELRREAYDLVVCDFLTPSINMPAPIGVPTVLFQHNVESMIWERHYRNETNRFKKAYFFGQWRKMLHYEGKACRGFDSVVAVSEVDRDLMRSEFGVKRVEAIPTGVDTDYFRPQQGAVNPHELVFTGSMDWMPNEDAIIYFCEQVLPRVRACVPDVSLTIVGRDPTPRVRALAGADPRVVVTGRVEDVRPYIDRAAAYVVPIRVGGGTRLKIYESMAMQKAIVSTTIGAEGLPVADGSEILLADSPDDFARAVVRVLSDTSFARLLGERAAATVREKFGWGRVAEKFMSLCERTLASAGAEAAGQYHERGLRRAV